MSSSECKYFLLLCVSRSEDRKEAPKDSPPGLVLFLHYRFGREPYAFVGSVIVAVLFHLINAPANVNE